MVPHMDELDLPLPIALRPGVVDAIVGGIRHAYETVANRHDPDDGFDGQTFGFSVYRVSWWHIERMLDQVPDVLYARPNHSLRIVADDYAISGVYRGGDRLDYDVHSFDFEAGTLTRAQAPRNNALQVPLFKSDDDAILAVESAEVIHELTVVHCGNPEDGCNAVFLGAPIFDVETGESRWVWVRRVYQLDLGELGGLDDGGRGVPPLEPDGAPYPGYDQMPEPTVPLEPVASDEPVQQ
jgi:hypothetical protein